MNWLSLPVALVACSVAATAGARELGSLTRSWSAPGGEEVVVDGHGHAGAGYGGWNTGCCEREFSCCDNVWDGYCGSKKHWCLKGRGCGHFGRFGCGKGKCGGPKQKACKPQQKACAPKQKACAPKQKACKTWFTSWKPAVFASHSVKHKCAPKQKCPKQKCAPRQKCAPKQKCAPPRQKCHKPKQKCHTPKQKCHKPRQKCRPKAPKCCPKPKKCRTPLFHRLHLFPKGSPCKGGKGGTAVEIYEGGEIPAAPPAPELDQATPPAPRSTEARRWLLPPAMNLLPTGLSF